MKILQIFIIFLFLETNYTNLNCELLDKFELIGAYEIHDVTFNIENLYYQNNTLYYFKPEIKDSIILLDLTNNKKYKLSLPNNIEFEGFNTYIICNDTIFYNDWTTFHAFKFSEKNISHLFSTDLSFTHKYMKKINDTIFVYDAVISSRGLIKKSFTNIEKIKLTIGKQSLISLPDPSAIHFSLIAFNKMIDIDSILFFVANYDKYKINIYTYNNLLIDSIEYKSPYWSNKIIDTFPSPYTTKLNPGQQIFKLKPFTMKNNFLNKIDILSSGILVCWSEPTGEEYAGRPKFDYWKKIDDNWKLVFENENFSHFDNDILKYFPSINLKYYNYKIIDKYLLLLIKGCTKDIYLNLGSIPLEELQRKINDFQNNNELLSVVIIYKFKGE